MQEISKASVTSVIDGLKKLYLEKLKPLEVTYRFNDFVSPLLVNSALLGGLCNRGLYLQTCICSILYC